MQAVTERNRFADPAAKGRVIRAGQHSVDGQAIRGRTHAARIAERQVLSAETLQPYDVAQDGTAARRETS